MVLHQYFPASAELSGWGGLANADLSFSGTPENVSGDLLNCVSISDFFWRAPSQNWRIFMDWPAIIFITTK